MATRVALMFMYCLIKDGYPVIQATDPMIGAAHVSKGNGRNRYASPNVWSVCFSEKHSTVMIPVKSKSKEVRAAKNRKDSCSGSFWEVV